ncbi:MAG: hypothetical protein HQK57_17235 [Deltaproteobacteria bacterium]|nr:hypothetical protein [Deltaproteobacteria bacterium]
MIWNRIWWNEKRRYRDAPFDIHPVPSATLNDLNRLQFEQEYLPNALAPEVLAANDRSYEQRLSACRMIAAAEDPVPTVLGLLVLGHRPTDFIPGASIQFLRIDGKELSDDIIDAAEIDGTVGRMVRALDDKKVV